MSYKTSCLLCTVVGTATYDTWLFTGVDVAEGGWETALVNCLPSGSLLCVTCLGTQGHDNTSESIPLFYILILSITRFYRFYIRHHYYYVTENDDSYCYAVFTLSSALRTSHQPLIRLHSMHVCNGSLLRGHRQQRPLLCQPNSV